MTGVIFPITTKETVSVTLSLSAKAMFRFRLGKPAPLALKGLDALYLLRVDQPDVTNALPLHLAAIQEAV
jgi:hypothetical protein